MPFYVSFERAIEETDLSAQARAVIRHRFLAVAERVERRNRNITQSYNLHRLTILLSGVIAPTLFTISEKVPPSTSALFWITLSASLAGSISSAWMEYFNIVKMHYTYLATSEALQMKGWAFASLSGNYRHYRSHAACWRKFTNRVGRIRITGINKYMINNSQGIGETRPARSRGMEEGGLNVGDLISLPGTQAPGSENPEGTIRGSVSGESAEGA